MTTEQKPPRGTVIELAPAAGRGEHWWPVAVAIIAVVGLHVVLPARYRVQPVWVIPVVLLALLAVLIAGDPGRIDRQKTWLRVLMGIVIAVITLANLLAAGRLVVDILTNNKLYAANPAGECGSHGLKVENTATGYCRILSNDFSKINYNTRTAADVINIASSSVVSSLTITNNAYHIDPVGWAGG